MTDSPDWRAIDRYLTGEASPAERAQVDAWLAADPRRTALLDTLRHPPVASAQAVDVDRAWARFNRNRPLDRPTDVLPLRRHVDPRIWRIVAAAVLLAGVGAAWQLNRERRESLAGSTPTQRTAAAAAANGERKSITLLDGTRVTLNGGSTLSLGANYGRRGRDVYLDGEGYFEVTHDAAHPFRVHAKQSIVEDLGTRFVVHAYSAQRIEVAVAEGLVSLQRDSLAGGEGVRLGAGDIAVLATSGTPTVTHGASLDRYFGWVSGSLVLDGLPLRDAAKELERWYNVHVVIGDSALAARPVVARFHGEPADQAIAAIALALGARVEQRGRTLTLIRKRS